MILIIDGPAEDALGFAQMLRGAKIARGEGAMILSRPDGSEHDLLHQVEKLLAGEPLVAAERARRSFPAEIALDRLAWKPRPMLLVAADNEDVLPQLEAVYPGIIARLGPTIRSPALI